LPFELHLYASEPFEGWANEHVQVNTVALSHRVPCHGYVFTETTPGKRLDVKRLDAEGLPRGPLWGELVHGRDVEYGGQIFYSKRYLCPVRPDQRVIICGDNDTPELLADVASDVNVLVHEATFTQSAIEHIGKGYGHSSAAAVAHFAESAQIPNLVLTHFSARYQSNLKRTPSIEEIRQEAKVHFTGELILASDLQRYHLGNEGRLITVSGPTR
jgi:ribonuclease Z